MEDSHFLNLIRDIKSQGGQPYLVGGYVRDRLLNQSVQKDRDLEVFHLPPHELKALCREHGRLMTVGAAFAVLKLQLRDGEVLDISIPRRERKAGTGHRGFDVEADPDMSVEEAAQRRDLTINAISMDPETETIVDPCNGRSDLEQKILRHVSHRFAEDPLRVLRVIQFAARLSFSVADDTMELCKGMVRKGELTTLPRERIEEELIKLFCKGRPDFIFPALKIAEDMGVYESLFPELHSLREVDQDPAYHAEGNVLVHSLLTAAETAALAQERNLPDLKTWILCLAALAHDLGKAVTTVRMDTGRITAHGHDRASVPLAQQFLDRLTANQRVISEVLALVRNHMRPFYLAAAEKVSDAAVRRLARDLQPATLQDLILLVTADTRASWRPDGSDQPIAMEYIKDRAETLGVDETPPVPVLMGRHLMDWAREGTLPKLYLRGGPHYKKLLDHIYEAQLDGLVESIHDARIAVLDYLGELHLDQDNEQEVTDEHRLDT